jgi:hypothetical protein
VSAGQDFPLAYCIQIVASGLGYGTVRARLGKE